MNSERMMHRVSMRIETSRKITKATGLVLLLGVLYSSNVYSHTVTSASVAPQTVPIQTELRFSRPIEVDAETVRRARTLRDIVRGVRPRLIVIPETFNVQWTIRCSFYGEDVAAEPGIYRAATGARAITTNNSILPPSQCLDIGPIRATVNEAASIPQAIKNYLLDQLLDLPLPRSFLNTNPENIASAIQQLVLNSSIPVRYFRRWNDVPHGGELIWQDNAPLPLIANQLLNTLTPNALALHAPGADAFVTLLFNANVNAQVSFNLCVLSKVAVAPLQQNLVLQARTSPQILPLTWTTTNQCLGTNPTPNNISSPSILFTTAGGAPIQSVSATLSQPGQTFGNAVFTDSVTVPPSVMQAVANSGGSGFLVQRSFTDGAVTRTASARVSFSGATGAPFSVTRMGLRYDDGSRVKIIPENGPLSVVADINFNGSGLLQAQWEIAGPTAPGGVPFFRPLQLVRQYLVGRQYAELASPPLPSTVDGMYFVRLIVQNPDRQQVSPLLRYFVGEYSEETAVALRDDLPKTIAALGPQPGAGASKGLQFAWSPVKRAATYQIEVYALDALDDKFVPADQPNAHSSLLVRKRPVTGIAVPAGQTSAEMSQLVKDYLKPGSYWWRVVANDKAGAIIAAGPLRRIEVR